MISRFPRKSFGYFLSGTKGGQPVEYVLMKENVRDEWKDDFHSYGQYFVDHDDAGFVATPEETWRVERYLREKGLHPVGVFHSHQRHPGLLAHIDIDLHPSPDLWHILVVLRNLSYPQLRAFEIDDSSVPVEMDIRVAEVSGCLG